VAFLPALATPDDRFAREWLERNEFALFMRMDPRDRLHGIQVARRLLELQPQAKGTVVRAALLHDVGKASQPYNPLYRVIVHLFSPPVPSEPRLSGLRGAFQVKQHHALYGGRMIDEAGGSAEVARIVANHHEPGACAAAALIARVDAET